MGKFTSQNKYEVSRQMGILNPEQILKSRQIGNSKSGEIQKRRNLKAAKSKSGKI
jgi:hypothetical protein